ncbi:hypothetical protein ACHQM5_007938 [Ranunculus cassubicifolius]
MATATYLTMTMIILAAMTASTANQQDLTVAIQEMRTATYFSFVTLINMFPPEKIPVNVTFLMPNDRAISEVQLPEQEVYNFLLRHSIPSPLLFDYLESFPTGATLPTSQQNFILRISNNGRKSFYVNNAQIISPNICTAGSSIRCHGIKGVLAPLQAPNGTFATCSPPPPTGHKVPSPPTHHRAPSPPNHHRRKSPPPLLPSPSDSFSSQISIAAAPPPTNLKFSSKKSNSPQLLAQGLFYTIFPCIILAVVTY